MSDIRKPPNQQENHDPETEQDTASGGPADPPDDDRMEAVEDAQ